MQYTYNINLNCKSRNGQRGSILFVVLWSLFFLSMLAVAIHAYLWPQLHAASKIARRSQMYYLAKAGVKKAMYVLGNDETEYDALNDLWSSNEDEFKHVQLGNGSFSVMSFGSNGDGDDVMQLYGIVDEERKININTAPFEVLKRFFETVAGISSQQAREIASSVIDWRDSDDEPGDDGAEDGYYSNLRPEYPCKDARFEALEELLLIRGMDNDIFNRVKNRLTIFGAGAVNVNTADMLVLQSLGMSESLAEKLIHFRNGEDGLPATEDDNIFESPGTISSTLSREEGLDINELAELKEVMSANLLCVRSNYFSAHSFGIINNAKSCLRIDAIFDRNKDIKYWREVNLSAMDVPQVLLEY